MTADGRSFASLGEKKYPTGKDLVQHHPGTTSGWFEVAKEQHFEEWLRLVREEAGKG